MATPFRALKRSFERQSDLNLKSSTSTSEDFYALKDVSFEVKQGEVLGIIGRNGAGKSTLLKILSRITEPTRGRIGIKGRVASLLEVGTGFHPELTGRENIYLNGAILGMTQAEVRSRFDEIVDFAGVEKFLDTAVKHFSSGMYVRLAFAVAAHLEPEILIIDEVLAVGDGEFQKKCLGKMHEAATAGRTILFVSHAMHTVTSLCQDAMILRKGEVFARGNANHVVNMFLQSTATGKSSDIRFQNGHSGVSLVGFSLTPSVDTIRIEGEFWLEHAIPDCGLGVHIRSQSGVELCSLRPETTGLRYGDQQGDLRVHCEIGELKDRLAAGIYRIELSLHQTNWKCCFEPTPIGEVVVGESDIYATGYPPKYEKDGAFVMPLRKIATGDH